MAEMARVFKEAKPDVAILVGNDQMEVFEDANIPTFMVCFGETVDNIPFSEDQKKRLAPGIEIAEPNHHGKTAEDETKRERLKLVDRPGGQGLIHQPILALTEISLVDCQRRTENECQQEILGPIEPSCGRFSARQALRPRRLSDLVRDQILTNLDLHVWQTAPLGVHRHTVRARIARAGVFFVRVPRNHARTAPIPPCPRSDTQKEARMLAQIESELSVALEVFSGTNR